MNAFPPEALLRRKCMRLPGCMLGQWKPCLESSRHKQLGLVE